MKTCFSRCVPLVGLLLSLLLSVAAVPLHAQDDYDLRRARNYLREAEYYEKRAASYLREAEYYEKRVASARREAAYWRYGCSSRCSQAFKMGSGMMALRSSMSMSSFFIKARLTVLTLADEPSWYFCITF